MDSYIDSHMQILNMYSPSSPNTHKNAIPVLSVAGSDCSGGAGVQADLKTFAAHGLYGMSIVLSVVAENTQRVISSVDLPSESIFAQFDAVFEDIPPRAVKIGMLGSESILESVAQSLDRYKPSNVVIDPVMFAKNGFPLMPESIRKRFASMMIPYADVLTPNLPEASELCGFGVESLAEMKRAAEILHGMGARAVLIKGGHSAHSADDVLYDGQEFIILQASKIPTKNTHGTGCTLSSAIASNLALGLDLPKAIERAKAYVFGAIAHALDLGKGSGPTNHLYIYNQD